LIRFYYSYSEYSSIEVINSAGVGIYTCGAFSSIIDWYMSSCAFVSYSLGTNHFITWIARSGWKYVP